MTGGKPSEKVQGGRSFLKTPFVDVSRKERQTVAHFFVKIGSNQPFHFGGLYQCLPDAKEKQKLKNNPASTRNRYLG